MRIQLLNPEKGRNRKVFAVFRRADVLRAMQCCGIEFVEERADVLFVGMADFINREITLNESIEQGIRFVDSLDAPVFLFDGSDSTSLMGAYEVFEQTSAWYLFKPALLDAAEYRTPSPFNRWFFRGESRLLLSYDIPPDLFQRLRLTGWNFGVICGCPNATETTSRPIDVSAIYRVYPSDRKYNADHLIRNDTYYTQHRMQPWRLLRDCGRPWSIVCETLSPAMTQTFFARSKFAISPFGMGEICYRDFEAVGQGCVLIKPDMSRVRTVPSVFVKNSTYVAVSEDFSDLVPTLDTVLGSNEEERRALVDSFRARFVEDYSPDILARYWANVLLNARAR